MSETTNPDHSSKFRREYKMRTSGRNGASVVTGIPKEPIERKMRVEGYEDIESFLEDYRAAVYFDGIDGVDIRFEKAE